MTTMHGDGLIELLSPLSHGGDTDGTMRMLRREKFRQPDGRYELVPVYSGNAFRGQLRDCGVRFMLNRLGMGEESLSPQAFYFLFSGGTLSKEPGVGLDLDRARRLREMIPLVGVFGGAVGRQILRGKLRMGRGVPVVQETRDYLPIHLAGQATETIYDALQVLEYTRTDDAKNEHLAGYLPAEARLMLEAPRTKITATGDEIAGEGAHQMRYGEETIAAGTLLYHEWFLEDASTLEFEAFITALYQFAQSPFIGGNSRIGHGKVAIRYHDVLTLEPRQVTSGEEIALRPGQAYLRHLDEHDAEVRAALGAIP